MYFVTEEPSTRRKLARTRICDDSAPGGFSRNTSAVLTRGPLLDKYIAQLGTGALHHIDKDYT